MFLPKALIELKALVPLPAALERFLARRPQGRRFPGLHVYVRGRVLDRYREEVHRSNTGHLPFARTDAGDELRVDLASGAVLRIGKEGAVEAVAPSFDTWLQERMQEAREVARRPVVRAARAGDVKKLERLLARGADINEQDIDGNTPLMAALLAWQYAAAHLLLARGADVALRDREGHTALMWAAYRNRPELVQQLLQAGADPNARTNSGEAVLLFALSGPYPLAEARPNGSAAVVELLIRAGAEKLSVAQIPAAILADADPEIMKLLERASNGLHGS
ncbi:ankyrin repeat domain-containing protein [Flaviaesturariibacter amylovorans]|uniref:Ankyrin repeat domain-containing protein n=1 Tax=Flaviaesturariibacter amylovorans TaxID=1084520 RepID=A0ABP8HT64_9BACT